MNARHEAKLTMFKGLEQHFDDNTPVVAVIVAFKTAVSAFKGVIANIITITQLKDIPLKGIAAGKDNFKQNLCRAAADIAGIIFAYASNASNYTLKAEVDFNHSKLIQTRDGEIALICQNIYDKAFENKDALKDYGINADKLAGLQAAIDNYAAETPKTRAALGNRKTFNSNLVAQFKEGDRMLKEVLDRLIMNYRQTHPDFYNTYFNLRTIPEPPTTKTQLKGKVTSSADQSPIKGAIVAIVETGKIAKTKSNGEYSFKPTPNGTFTVRVTAEGFEDFEKDEVEVKLGEINHLDMELLQQIK